MSDLTPTPDFPGIRIGKEGPYGPAYADYACRCGQSAGTTNGGSVEALVDEYTDHKNACQGRRA